jgi:hypothetical protein
MDLIYNFAKRKSSLNSTKQFPQWKIDMSLQPALTTRDAASAFADIDLNVVLLKTDAQEAELFRWYRVMENAASSREIPSELIANEEDVDIWMFSHSDFAAWCASKGVTNPLPFNAIDPNDASSFEKVRAGELISLEPETIDTTSFVTWQALMLESWGAIRKAHNNRPTARQAMSWLKKNGARDVIPEHQPDRESMYWYDQERSLHKVKIGSIGNRISEWKKDGLIRD